MSQLANNQTQRSGAVTAKAFGQSHQARRVFCNPTLAPFASLRLVSVFCESAQPGQVVSKQDRVLSGYGS